MKRYTQEELFGFPRATLISLVEKSGKWPRTTVLHTASTKQLVDFVLRLQDTGMRITDNFTWTTEVLEDDVEVVKAVSPKMKNAQNGQGAQKNETSVTPNHLADEFKTLRTEVLAKIDELSAEVTKLNAKIERVLNCVLHIYSVHCEPQPSSYFDTPFDKFLNVEEPTEQKEPVRQEESTEQEELTKQREANEAELLDFELPPPERAQVNFTQRKKKGQSE